MTTEQDIEADLIRHLTALKYCYRPDITDLATLENNFRQKFDSLNRVTLTDLEFERLKNQIIKPEPFQASKKPFKNFSGYDKIAVFQGKKGFTDEKSLSERHHPKTI